MLVISSRSGWLLELLTELINSESSLSSAVYSAVPPLSLMVFYSLSLYLFPSPFLHLDFRALRSNSLTLVLYVAHESVALKEFSDRTLSMRGSL